MVVDSAISVAGHRLTHFLRHQRYCSGIGGPFRHGHLTSGATRLRSRSDLRRHDGRRRHLVSCDRGGRHPDFCFNCLMRCWHRCRHHLFGCSCPFNFGAGRPHSRTVAGFADSNDSALNRGGTAEPSSPFAIIDSFNGYFALRRPYLDVATRFVELLAQFLPGHPNRS